MVKSCCQQLAKSVSADFMVFLCTILPPQILRSPMPQFPSLLNRHSQMPREGGQGKKIENSKLIKREVVPDLQGVLNMLAFPPFPSSAWMDGSEDIYQSPHRERSINICRVKVLWSPRLVASLCSSGKPPEIRGLRAQLNFLPGASLFSSFF